MSATRDKTQKIAFVYSNLYQLYRKGKDAAINADSGIDFDPSKIQSAKPAAPAGAPKGEVSPELVNRLREEASKLLRGSGTVIKTEDLSAPLGVLRVKKHNPIELLGKRLHDSAPASALKAAAPVAAPAEGVRQLKIAEERSIASGKPQVQAVQSLKDNLKALNDLHSRLRFMLKELEELVKD